MVPQAISRNSRKFEPGNFSSNRIAGDAVSPELATALRSPMEKAANRLMTVSLLVLTYLMIVKPG